MEIKKLAKMLGLRTAVITEDVLIATKIGSSIDADFDQTHDQNKMSKKMFQYFKIYLKALFGLNIILLLDEFLQPKKNKK